MFMHAKRNCKNIFLNEQDSSYHIMTDSEN